MSAYPEVVVYCVEEPDGKLNPVVAAVAGLALPIVDAAIEMSPNGSRHGTRALTATLSIVAGACTRIEVVEDVASLDGAEVVSTKDLDGDSVGELLRALGETSSLTQAEVDQIRELVASTAPAADRIDAIAEIVARVEVVAG